MKAELGEVHICFATVDAARPHFSHCPTCKGRRKFWAWFQHWYGWTVTCLRCGDRWQDGEMLERPFKPRWRQENIDHARKMMAEVGTVAMKPFNP